MTWNPLESNLRILGIYFITWVLYHRRTEVFVHVTDGAYFCLSDFLNKPNCPISSTNNSGNATLHREKSIDSCDLHDEGIVSSDFYT